MVLFLSFLILNRCLFFRLPLHGDIGFFGIWGHFQKERLDHDLILHNGGFRSAALYIYWFFHRLFGKLGVKFSSRFSQLVLVVISWLGWEFLFQNLGWNREVVSCFFLFYAILLSSFSTGCVYIYTIELFGICALPFLLGLYFLPIPFFALKLGLALFGALFFKLNLAFDVVIFFAFMRIIDSGLELSGILHFTLGLGLGSILYFIYLKLLGILGFSIHGFLAFFKCRNEGWYAWKRLLFPFLGPILLENIIPFLALIPAMYWIFTNPHPTSVIALLLLFVEVGGVILQRGFFHYHYIAILPGVALVSAFSVQLIPWTDYALWILLVYTSVRFFYSKRQFWPKALEHQEIYNVLVDELEEWELFKEIRSSKICWFAGWRFQFHLRHDLAPFSVFLQTVKFMMIMDPEDERKFFPDFPSEFQKRLENHCPDLLVLEENELIHLGSIRNLGFEVRYLGTFKGRLKFFRLELREIPSVEEIQAVNQELFLRYPGHFQMAFFEKMTPQYLEQCGNQIIMVGENPLLNDMINFLKKNGVEIMRISNEDFLNRATELEGDYFLIEEGRSIALYNQVHQLISDRFRIFKYT